MILTQSLLINQTQPTPAFLRINVAKLEAQAQLERSQIEAKIELKQRATIDKQANDLAKAQAEIERLEAEIRRLKAPNPKPKPRQHTQVINGEQYVVTAYTAGYESTQKHAGEAGYGITASGNTVQAGVSVACPRELPFGTRLDIEGIGVRTCDDRGNAIQGKRLDVYMPELTKAREFGRKTLKVRILD